MKKFVYIAICWYLKTFKGLNISDLYKKIANKTNVKVLELRMFEKLMIRTILRKMDIIYLKKCEELSVIPDFLKFKPPRLDVYENVQKFYHKVLLEQIRIANREFYSAKKARDDMMQNLRGRLTISQYQLLLQQIRDLSINRIAIEKRKTH